MPEIVLKNITKKWGNFVGVDNLNLVIKDHAFVTLLGPSGCGKTTTLRMIAGLETPTSGEITIDGKVVFSSEKGINIPPNKRNVGFLFQNYALWPHMTVYKNIAFDLENLKWPKEKIKERVDELLKMLKIEEFVKRYPSELSGGQQQRVAIARTLAPNPQVLFMDEPLSNLDAKLRLEMRTELKRLHMETNSTFVYVTHDQLEAMTLATEVCLMEKGLLQQYDPPLTVYANPNNLFVADFVGNPTMNFINAEVIKHDKKTVDIRFQDINAKYIGECEIDLTKVIPPAPVEEAAKSEEKTEQKKKFKNLFKSKKATKKTEETIVAEEIEEKVESTIEAKAETEVTKIEDAPIVEESTEETEVILGIRPEYVKISETEGIDATVYSSLPSGMETIVKVKIGDVILTSVVFGIIDYPVDTKIKVSFTGDKIVLFNKTTTQRITDGVIEISANTKKKVEAPKEESPAEPVEKKPAIKKAKSTTTKKTAAKPKKTAE